MMCLHSMLLLLLLLLSATSNKHATATSLNLLLFNDPKDVESKKNSPKQRFQTTTKSCPRVHLPFLERDEFLKSQDNEDRCLFSFFNGLCHGTYLDLGALDGVRYSNSFAFHMYPGLQWKGVNVELVPRNYEALVSNRPRDMANIHAAVCDLPQQLHYVETKSNVTNGIWEFANEAFREQYWKNVHFDDTTPINCVPTQIILDQVLLAFGDPDEDKIYFDFFSLDIEGGELAALRGIDFDRIGFGIIIVERNTVDSEFNKEVKSLLKEKGYDRIDDITSREDCATPGFPRNYWYINREFETIYEHVTYSYNSNLRG